MVCFLLHPIFPVLYDDTDDESYLGFQCRHHLFYTIHALPDLALEPCFFSLAENAWL